MKTWITYIAALFMGFSTMLLFGSSVSTIPIMLSLSTLLMNIGTLLFIPFILISLSSGVASLRKDKLGKKCAKGIISWSLVTTIILPLVAVFLFLIYPVSFPVSSTAGYTSINDSLISGLFSKASSAMLSSNIFYTLATSDNFFLPILIISLVLGYALRPNADVIKPAYIAMNSFSEVLFRLNRLFSTIGYLLVYTSSTLFFTQLYQEKTIFVSPHFLILFVSICAILSLIVLPILYLIFTKGKRNPYKDTIRSLSAIIAGLTSSNILAISPIIAATSRHNNGVQKRLTATSTPIFIMISRAGTAAISAISVVAIVLSVTGAVPTIDKLIIIALLSALASFASSIAVGYEVIITCLLVFKLANISLYGAEMTILGLLPLINGLAILLDTQLAMLGNVVTSVFVETSLNPPYKDII